MKTIEPIATFHSPFTSKFGIPRQSGLIEELKGRIVFEHEFRDKNALRGIEGFDYLWLIWGFNTPTTSFHPTVRPPRLGGNERIGVFASRSPFRPNGLGLSSVRLLKVDNGDLIVGGADLMDGTPIYDIKPYLSYVDSHPNARGGFTDKHAWHRLSVDIPDAISRRLPKEQLRQLTEVLALDPRPRYQDDASRIYGMPYNGMDIHFKVAGDTLTVVSID